MFYTNTTPFPPDGITLLAKWLHLLEQGCSHLANYIIGFDAKDHLFGANTPSVQSKQIMYLPQTDDTFQ